MCTCRSPASHSPRSSATCGRVVTHTGLEYAIGCPARVARTKYQRSDGEAGGFADSVPVPLATTWPKLVTSSSLAVGSLTLACTFSSSPSVGEMREPIGRPSTVKVDAHARACGPRRSAAPASRT